MNRVVYRSLRGEVLAVVHMTSFGHLAKWATRVAHVTGFKSLEMVYDGLVVRCLPAPWGWGFDIVRDPA